MKQQTAEEASLIADRFRGKTGRAGRLVRDRTLDPVVDNTARAAAQAWAGATRASQYAADETRDTLLEGRAGRHGRTRRPHSAPGRQRCDHHAGTDPSQPWTSPMKAFKVASGKGDAPDAADEYRTWEQVLLAAAIRGAIFAVVKASVDRSGAVEPMTPPLGSAARWSRSLSRSVPE